jgi:hypothetical protein
VVEPLLKELNEAQVKVVELPAIVRVRSLEILEIVLAQPLDFDRASNFGTAAIEPYGRVLRRPLTMRHLSRGEPAARIDHIRHLAQWQILRTPLECATVAALNLVGVRAVLLEESDELSSEVIREAIRDARREAISGHQCSLRNRHRSVITGSSQGQIQPLTWTSSSGSCVGTSSPPRSGAGGSFRRLSLTSRSTLSSASDAISAVRCVGCTEISPT